MESKIYAVFDSKALVYRTPPFFMATDGMAVRAMSDLVNSPETEFYRHTQDFTLYQIGLFEDSTGAISGIEPRAVLHLPELIDERRKNGKE